MHRQTISVFYLAALIIGLSSVLSGTTIVGIWTEKQITIAADSKQTVTQGERIVGSQTACKVYVVRNIVVALAGLAAAEGISVVDSIRTSRELINQDTRTKLPETSLVVGAEAALVQVLNKRNSLSDPNFNVALIVAGKIGGKLQMFREELVGMTIFREYSMPSAMRRIAYPESRGYNGSDRNRGFEVIGISDAIKRFQKILPDWNKGDDVSVAKRLVGIEASDASGSRFVGPPISAVIIDKKGVRWIDKGVCE
jgi:hypothetical protein